MLKKKLSQFLSLLIVAALVVAGLPVNVLANDANATSSTEKNPEEEIKFDSGSAVEAPATDFEYTIEDSKVTIDRYIGSATEVVIPAEIEGYPVTSIGDYAFYWCDSLTSITLPEGLTSIGEWTFAWCDSLTSITLPEGVTSIGDYAFKCCSALTSITLPEGVTSIGDYAFYACISLTSITVSENNTKYSSQDGVLFDKDKTAIICCPAAKNGKYVIPDSVTSIGDSAFYNCWLTSITLPEGLTSIGDYAFEYCSALTSITLPEGVTSIGDSVFYSCTSLTSITVSEINTKYSSKDGVLFDKDKTIIICCPAGKSGEYIVPNSVTSIGYSAFYGCSALTSITLPEGVTNIGDYAFEYCSSLTSITLPEGVTSIGDHAFYGCTSLISITLPEGLTSIGDSVFVFCDSLISIVVPKSIKSIGNRVFEGCFKFKNIYYTGTEAEWNAIEIAANNDSLNNATIHFNYVPGALPEEITPSEGSDVVVDAEKAIVSGIPAESKPDDVIAQFKGSENIQIVGKDGKVLADDALVGTGCKVQLIENGEVKDEVTVVIKGEIDGNGKIDSNDAIYLLRNTLFPQLYKVVVEDDVDGNGEYNSNDAIYLLRYTLFPGLYPLK